MYVFTVIHDIANEKIKKIYKNIFEEDYNNMFNSDGIYISGSSIIQMLDETNSDILNDLDIYIDIRYFNINKAKNILFKLFSLNFTIKKKSGLKEFNKIINKINKLYISGNSNKSNISKNHAYFSLAEYITKILTLTNYKNGKKIDLIFIHCGIKKLLLKTFDFDIIKNYYCKGSIYIHNFEALENKIATISISHFYNRILNNIFEFKNFIIRYQKYSNRGYDIYIGDSLICSNFVNYMTYILLTNIFNKDESIYKYIQHPHIRFDFPKISFKTGIITQTLNNKNYNGYKNIYPLGKTNYTDLNIKSVNYNVTSKHTNNIYKSDNLEYILKNLFIFHTKINEEIIKKYWSPENLSKILKDSDNLDELDNI